MELDAALREATGPTMRHVLKHFHKLTILMLFLFSYNLSTLIQNYTLCVLKLKGMVSRMLTHPSYAAPKACKETVSLGDVRLRRSVPSAHVSLL